MFNIRENVVAEGFRKWKESVGMLKNVTDFPPKHKGETKSSMMLCTNENFPFYCQPRFHIFDTDIRLITKKIFFHIFTKVEQQRYFFKNYSPYEDPLTSHFFFYKRSIILPQFLFVSSI